MPQHLQKIVSTGIQLAASFAIAQVALAAAAPALAAPQFSAEGRFERALNVTGAVEMSVQSGAGSIRVRGGGAGKVYVIGVIRARDSWCGGASGREKVKRLEENPPIRQNGNVIEIGRIEERELRENVSISFEIVTPADTRLHSSSGSGSLTVEGLSSPVDADTGSGSIEANGIKGSLRASTGSGSIRARGIAGWVKASTGSGSIEVEQVAAGDFEGDTGSGRITVSGVRGALRASTGSGSIRVDGVPQGAWRISTSSGGISLRLPQNASFEVNARTCSGSITPSHPITLLGRVSKRELRGKVREGGPLLDLSTSSGNIHIE
jgi:hypothetical protein